MYEHCDYYSCKLGECVCVCGFHMMCDVLFYLLSL